MSHTPNELIDMFPEAAEKIHALKVVNGEFSSIFDEYHQITREIHRGETNVEPMDDFHMAELRKLRLYLLDQVAAIPK
ncbi:MAG: DUF465 domain-containing protein [Paracoccaceae bacterium]|jgi:uncharacterized protein YdcH (DUF465 family)